MVKKWGPATGIGALARHLLPEERDQPKASAGEQMKGFRLICTMDAKEYENKRTQNQMSDDEISYALGQHLQADDCEISNAKVPNTKLVVFRWQDMPGSAVLDRLKGIPTRFLSGRRLKLLLYGKLDDSKKALPL
jgi:hypothetical protein